MLKRNKNLLTALTLLTNIISNNRIVASKTVLIAQALENPRRAESAPVARRSVPLLLRPFSIVLQYLINDRSEEIELRPRTDDTLLIARRNGMLQHLGNRSTVDAKM
jgi:hypothetical protein